MFITVSTRALYLFLHWTRIIPLQDFPFFKIYFNIVILCIPISYTRSSFSRFPRQNIVFISVLPQICHIHHHSYSPLFDTEIKFGEKHESRVYTIRSIIQSPAISSLLESNAFLSTPFSNNFNLSSSLNARTNF